MDFALTPKQKNLKKEFESFFKKEMQNAPQEYKYHMKHAAYESDKSFGFHRYMAKKLGEKGWISRAWPEKYGGQAAPLIEQLIFNEAREKYHAPGVDLIGVGMFAPTLMVGADEEQKKRLLPPIASGDCFYCQGWSEPDAGSDLASLCTTAIKKDDHFIVNGQKVWTSGAQHADSMFLLARTDPNSKRGKGLSIFHLDMDYPGIEIKPIYYLNRKHYYNEVFLKDVKIPVCDRIGPENEGWKLTRETMNFERSGVAHFATGKIYLNAMIEYVKKTKRDNKYLYENPVIRNKIAKLYSDLELGHSFSYKIAWMQQQGGMKLAASAASQSKVFGTELIQRIANYSSEIMGLYGQVEQSKWAPIGGSIADTYQSCIGSNISSRKQ